MARRALKSLSGHRVGEARQFDPWFIGGKHRRLVRCFLGAKKFSKKLGVIYLGCIFLLKLDVVTIRVNNYNRIIYIPFAAGLLKQRPVARFYGILRGATFKAQVLA